MPDSKTLHYPNARHLNQLYGGNEDNLARVEKALGCRLTTRDDWLKLDGPVEAVTRTEEFFALLNSGKTQGLAVRTPDFVRLLDLYAKDGGAHFDANARRRELDAAARQHAGGIADGMAWARAALEAVGDPGVAERLQPQT